MSKIEILNNDKWEMTIALEESSVEKLLKYAELLQYHDVEEYPVDDIVELIDKGIEDVS